MRNAEKQRRRGTERRIIWTLALLALAALGLLLGVVAQDFGLDDAQAFINAPLPLGAQDVQFATDDQFVRIVWLRFSLPPQADVSAWVRQIGLEELPRDGFTPFPQPNYTEAALAWWTPHAASSYAGLHDIHAGKVYELLLDRSTSAWQIIYLRVYAL